MDFNVGQGQSGMQDQGQAYGQMQGNSAGNSYGNFQGQKAIDPAHGNSHDGSQGNSHDESYSLPQNNQSTDAPLVDQQYPSVASQTLNTETKQPNKANHAQILEMANGHKTGLDVEKQDGIFNTEAEAQEKFKKESEAKLNPAQNAGVQTPQNLEPQAKTAGLQTDFSTQNAVSQTQVQSLENAPKNVENQKEEEEKAQKDKEIAERRQALQDCILSGNIPQLVMVTISYALDMRSSDIHIEPLENHVRLRYRVDGVLMHIVEYPNNLHPAVVSRIKIMSNLKIDEQRVPQDGRADVTTKEGKEMDLRVSTLPTVNGEKIVMRLQDKSRKIPDLPELGIEGASLKNLEESLKAPNGIIITTGPTGSGKTTTLYSCLNRKNTVDVNILTIEDPVEIQMDGLSQSQVHHDIDYTFASGMRAALRQDPDIIMVGEIRDKETADTAIEASLTGHLVFSTLHTNSAVESLTRIINMGIPGYLLNSTIELIIAQRLVRKLCPHCKKEHKPDDEILEVVNNAMEGFEDASEIDPELLKNMKFYTAEGCDECNGIGYKGRVGLYEVLRMNNDIRRLISENAATMDIQKVAQESGMITLEQAGIIKALNGITSLDEVYRVSRKSF